MAKKVDVTKQLKDAGLTEADITKLKDNDLLDAGLLTGTTVEELTSIGFTLGKAKLVKKAFPSGGATVTPTAAPSTNSADLATVIQQLGTQLTQAFVAADREVCPNCGAVMVKNFTGKTCTKCGLPMKRVITCIACGTENREVKESDYCSNCGEMLITGETRQQVAYLIRVKGFKSGPALAELKRIKEDEKEYARFKAQVEAWVEEGGYADVATFFRVQTAGRTTF